MSQRQQGVRRLKELASEIRDIRGRLTFAKQVPRLLEVKYEAAAIVATYLGSDHYLVRQLNDLPIRTVPLVVVRGVTEEPPATKFLGLVNAAVAVLEGTYGHAEPHPPICNPVLWAHVEELVVIEAWAKVPAAVVTFVEDWYRKRGGNPVTEKGAAPLVGGDLFSRVLRDLPLGRAESERQGWQGLARRLAQASGNRNRHNVEDRADAE